MKKLLLFKKNRAEVRKRNNFFGRRIEVTLLKNKFLIKLKVTSTTKLFFVIK